MIRANIVVSVAKRMPWTLDQQLKVMEIVKDAVAVCLALNDIPGRVLDTVRVWERQTCDVCSRTDVHRHCPECGSTEHVASECDMMG